jgi:hypothetical protein
MTNMKTQKYPFAKDSIFDGAGKVSQVVIDFSDYELLLEAMEDEALSLAMMEVKDEISLDIETALAELESE